MGPLSAELFKNCFNLTDTEITAIALARGITAAVCGVTSLTVLVILALVNCYHHRVCGTVVKRLVVGFIVSSVLIQLVLALELVHYFQPELKNFCRADSFFCVYLKSVQLLFTLVISLVLFFTVCGATTSWKCSYKDTPFTCCGWKINRLETLLFVSVFCFPLLFDWIPFTTDSYGPFGPFCYIQWLENNCSRHDAGSLEMLLLLNAPFVSVGLLTFGLFMVSLCLLGFAVKSKPLNKMAITDFIFSLALLSTLYFLLTVTAFLIIWKSRPFAFWLLVAIYPPAAGTLIPLVYLVAVHLPVSTMILRVCCKCRGYTQIESDDQATLHASSVLQQPSYTTWNPSHSTNTCSQTLPLSFDKQIQEYESMA